MFNLDKQWLLKEKYQGEKSPAFFADCQRLEAGEPLGYVIGFVPFLGCKIWLDSHPLIPRPETEWWVEKVITSIRDGLCSPELQRPQRNYSERGQAKVPVSTIPVSEANIGPEVGAPDSEDGSTQLVLAPSIVTANASPTRQPIAILDLCAGSGCIGVALAKHLQEAHVTFGEIDPGHLPTIFKNLAENGIDCTRYKAFTSDLFSNISGTFDIIVSNPPYIDPVLDRTEVSVKDFEPHEALYGGQGGMALIAQIIATSPTFLNPSGQLWLEHEPEQTDVIHSLATENGFVVITHRDQYQVERYSVLVLQ